MRSDLGKIELHFGHSMNSGICTPLSSLVAWYSMGCSLRSSSLSSIAISGVLPSKGPISGNSTPKTAWHAGLRHTVRILYIPSYLLLNLLLQHIRGSMEKANQGKRKGSDCLPFPLPFGSGKHRGASAPFLPCDSTHRL